MDLIEIFNFFDCCLTTSRSHKKFSNKIRNVHQIIDIEPPLSLSFIIINLRVEQQGMRLIIMLSDVNNNEN